MVSNMMTSAWIHFAHDLDPNGNGTNGEGTRRVVPCPRLNLKSYLFKVPLGRSSHHLGGKCWKFDREVFELCKTEIVRMQWNGSATMQNGASSRVGNLPWSFGLKRNTRIHLTVLRGVVDVFLSFVFLPLGPTRVAPHSHALACMERSWSDHRVH